MAKRYFTGTTCGNGSVISFITDDLILTANPLNRVYQLGNGTCFTLTASGATTTNYINASVVYGPYTSCTLCITPVNSAGVEPVICETCDNGSTVSAITVNHSIYTNSQNRAISQTNTVNIGGFNGLNN
jgi:hypothetical protein